MHGSHQIYGTINGPGLPCWHAKAVLMNERAKRSNELVGGPAWILPHDSCPQFEHRGPLRQRGISGRCSAPTMWASLP